MSLMLSIGVPRSLASMLTIFSGCSRSTSRPKKGTPVRPICRRGSGWRSIVRVTITNARPVIGPSWICGTKDTSKRSFDGGAGRVCAEIAAASATLATTPAVNRRNDLSTIASSKHQTNPELPDARLDEIGLDAEVRRSLVGGQEPERGARVEQVERVGAQLHAAARAQIE